MINALQEVEELKVQVADLKVQLAEQDATIVSQGDRIAELEASG